MMRAAIEAKLAESGLQNFLDQKERAFCKANLFEK